MNFSKLAKQDFIITIILVILAIFSLSLVFSTTFNANNPLQGQNTVYRQIIFFAVGFGLYFLISSIDISWFKQKTVAVGIYIFILISLIYVITLGDVIQETQRWIVLGPLSFQPAEFAKLAIIILNAYIFGRHQQRIEAPDDQESKKEFYISIAISVATALLYAFLIFIQPSLGNTLIFLAIWVMQLYLILPLSKLDSLAIFTAGFILLIYFEVGIFSQIAEASFLSTTLWKLFCLLSLGIIFISLNKLFKISSILLISLFLMVSLIGPTYEYTWNNVLKPYHRSRVESFLNGFNSDPLDQDYQVKRSISAFGSGQFSGQGYLQGDQSTLNILPFAHTDFIFAALGEQFGNLGVNILFILYGLLIFRIHQILLETRDIFGKILVMGVIAIVSLNLLINTAMNIGLIPVTGVPLPVLSYGGSSVLLMMISLGLVQMVKISKRTDSPALKLERFFAID